LTPHVRHQTKYVDIPVVDDRAFVFTQNGTGTPRRVRTLNDFVKALDEIDAATLGGYLRRSDFSRWIAEVFGDAPLAKTVHRLENEYRAGARPDVVLSIAQAVRSRYDFPLEIEPAPEPAAPSPSEPPVATPVTQAS
jgi:hypothetical protein